MTERRINLLLAALTGILLGAAFPPIPTGVTAFVGFMPFLLLLGRMDSAARTFRMSYVAFLVLNVVTVYWISGWWGRDPWLKAAGVAVNLVHPLLFTIPSLMLYLVRKRLGWNTMLLVFPFLWATWEWLAHLPELSFPWLVVGNTQTYDIAKIQFIAWTGVFGASWWIAAVNSLLVFTAECVRSGTWSLRSRPAIGMYLAALLLLMLPHVWGVMQMQNSNGAPTLRVGIAQPDIDPYEKWSAASVPLSKVDDLMRLYDTVASVGRADLVLLPETAFPFLIRQPSYREELLAVHRHVDSLGVPLLSGFADLTWYDPGTGPATAKRIPESDLRYDTFNAAMLVLPMKTDQQVYRKSRLTPLSERIPYLDALPFLQTALSWGVGISSWGLGNDTTVFTLDEARRSARIWPMICYETLYPSFVAGFTERGADMLAVITNDGWFGNSSGPYQLQQYTVLRAIENRRAIARCANNGVSCFIDPWGRITGETRFGTRTWTVAEVPLHREASFYVRHGDWFAQGCAIVALLVLLAAMLRRSRPPLR